MPNVSAIIAFDVARFLVVLPEVERLALVGPLLGAVVAGDDGLVVVGLVAGFGLQRRPVGGTRAVAGGFAAGILVECIQRHALGVSERQALRGRSDTGRRLRVRARKRGQLRSLKGAV